MNLGEFDSAKGLLQVLVPISLVLVCRSVRDFLSVRALGLVVMVIGVVIAQYAAAHAKPVSH